MISLSERLSAVASLVTPGSRIADIGCDHGYVSAYLVSGGIAVSAVAADVNIGPLKSCQSLIDSMGLGCFVDVRLCNGLDGIDEAECDTVIIAGMGGELIASILAKCPYIKKKSLVLQPMTHPEAVREYLFKNGFEIEHDIIVAEGRRSYCVIRAVPGSAPVEYNQVDLYLGRIQDFSDKNYFNKLKNTLENRQKGGADYSAVIDRIKEIL